MDIKDMASRASERIRSVFSKNNSFFYGKQPYEPQAEESRGYAPADYAQAGYATDAQLSQQQYAPGAWQQQTQAYQQPQASGYQQPTMQGYAQQPVQQGQYPYAQPQNPYVQPQQANWQAPQQAFESQYSNTSYAQGFAPQQAQLQQEQDRRNRRSAQHEQAPDQSNLVQFPGVPQEPETSPQMDAYVVNVSSVSGCRQAMTCLRKGQCTLVVMDQLIDKAEVRRYVDMLNGACFALGGTMTRLSLKVGFYLLAPSGMTVYTDPVTASANAPRPQAMPQQASPVQAYQAPMQQPVQPYFPQQGQYAQQPPSQMQQSNNMPYQAPMQYQAGYAPAGYQDERFAQ